MLCFVSNSAVLSLTQARSQMLLHMELFGFDSIVIRCKEHHNYPCPLGAIKCCTALWKFRFPSLEVIFAGGLKYNLLA